MRIAIIIAALAGCADQGDRVNPGAVTGIYSGALPEWLDRPVRGQPYVVHGLYRRSDDSIHSKYVWTDACGSYLHEYQHHLERRLQDAGDLTGLRVARKAFRDLNAGTFELGFADLLTDTP